MVLEKKYRPKKVASWWVMSFWKKNWSVPNGPAQGGNFKEFRLIFVVLGFKWHQMGQNMKMLSQKSYIFTSWNIILQKSPKTPKSMAYPPMILARNNAKSVNLMIWLVKMQLFFKWTTFGGSILSKTVFLASKMWPASLLRPVGCLIFVPHAIFWA